MIRFLRSAAPYAAAAVILAALVWGGIAAWRAVTGPEDA